MAGRFEGRVAVEWLTHQGEDRLMRLLEDFAFVDPAGVRWEVPQDAKIDGASIPQIFWTMFGSPFVGNYRRASVVHDRFCETRSRPSSAVHRMFYEACLVGGVPQIKAKTMYAAVRTFGPNWETLITALRLPGVPEIAAGSSIRVRTSMEQAEFEKIVKWIEAENPDVQRIDAEIEEKQSMIPDIPEFSIEGLVAPH